MTRTVTLIPWRDGEGPEADRRRLLWDWTLPHLESLGWPVFTGAGPDGPFGRSAAINEAARAAGDWDVALVGDADTAQQPSAVFEGAELAGRYGLAVPWTHRVKLSREGTDRFARGWAVTDSDRDKRDGTSPHGGGATIVISREAFDAVGGFDERFVGYGNEDLAFRAAVETLVVGNGAPRALGLVWHLWHRTQSNVGTNRAAVPGNRELWRRYRAARWDEDAMRELIAR